MVDVKLPAALASECAGQRHLHVDLPDDATLADVLDAIATTHPRLARRLRDESGKLRRYVNIYIGDDENRRLQGLATPVEGRDIQILPSIAGG
ncbi:ubiquitin-like small modifier protein 1 [Glycomyces harbinensis]|uniref:Molybdopterin converting factor, small subunit n=1 Tax=Glycomyces harbinensis TaxID=58114 RepID=A0A1G6RBM1_9ACTN|nr:ubiquitin-like small modifier protein 1 [Glycomyces harbinensis]SDD02022.1 Molybdopterin converting factor, small subunit [Glycomyces harbinensis]